jgi:hypothetical protein
MSTDWEYEWPLLSEARARLDDIILGRAIAAGNGFLHAGDLEDPPAVDAFKDAICSGAVPVLAIRNDCDSIAPSRVEVLLAAAKRTITGIPDNGIHVFFDARIDRSIFGPRSVFSDTARYPPAGDLLLLQLIKVQVHWPTFVNKLAAVGIEVPKYWPTEGNRVEAVLQRPEPSASEGDESSVVAPPITPVSAPQRGRPPDTLQGAVDWLLTKDPKAPLRPIVKLAKEYGVDRDTMTKAVKLVEARRAKKSNVG